MNILRWITYAAVLIGALNWGLIGAFDFNLVSFLFGNMTTMSRIIYTLVGLSAITYFVLSFNDQTDCIDCNC